MTEHRPRQSADERRAAIVDAAVIEFGAHGLDGATTDAIARRAGISQPYVIRLFGSKRALFEAAVDRVYSEVERAFVEAAEGVEQDQRIPAMGEAYMKLLDDRDLLLMHLQTFAAAGDTAIRELVRERMAAMHARVRELSGADPDRLREFFALGMLLNVVAALDLPEMLGPPDWRERLRSPPK